MIKIRRGLQKRKVKIFLLFLLFSGLAWFITKLSENATGRAVFDLQYNNVPDSLLFIGASQDKIEVKLKASGFTFLGFSFKNQKLDIDLSKIHENNGVYTVPRKTVQMQIEKQLPKSMELLSIDDGNTIVLELYKLAVKKIPVISALQIQLAQNFMLDSAMEIKPDSITINGPIEQIKNITSVRTEEKILTELNANFSENLALHIPKKIKNVKYTPSQVTIKGTVVRFSEKIIKLPIKVINLPEGFEIKIFPNAVDVLCKAKIDRLKTMVVQDFMVVADYNLISKTDKKTIPLKLKEYPQSINSARLMNAEVTYILKRK